MDTEYIHCGQNYIASETSNNTAIGIHGNNCVKVSQLDAVINK